MNYRGRVAGFLVNFTGKATPIVGMRFYQVSASGGSRPSPIVIFQYYDNAMTGSAGLASGTSVSAV